MSYTDDHCRAGFMPNDEDCPCKLCIKTREVGKAIGDYWCQKQMELLVDVFRKNDSGSSE